VYKRIEEAPRRIQLTTMNTKNIKMKTLKYSLLAISICFVTACSKSDIIENQDTEFVLLNESVSGNASIDSDGDGIADTPLRETKIYLGPYELLQDVVGQDLDSLTSQAGGEIYKDFKCVSTDMDGNYIFESIPPFENYALALYTEAILEKTIGKDDTPDGDPLEEESNEVINIALQTDEQDDGNNFVVEFKELKAGISGYVNIDINQDGMVDGGQANVRINLALAHPDGNPMVETLNMASTLTNENGYYNFDNIAAGDYVVVFMDVEQYIWISSGDDSPDSDVVLDPSRKWIPASVTDEEIDTDNNFSVGRTRTSAAGNVLEDTDGNGIGDLPVYDLRIELYERNGDGVPMMPRIADANTDINGFYSFSDLPVGEYVIYFIGAPGYECIKGEDETPEAGEPLQSPQAFFIPMNVLDPNDQDLDNVFTVKKI